MTLTLAGRFISQSFPSPLMPLVLYKSNTKLIIISKQETRQIVVKCMQSLKIYISSIYKIQYYGLLVEYNQPQIKSYIQLTESILIKRQLITDVSLLANRCVASVCFLSWIRQVSMHDRAFAH
ncbi:hypothetical protein FGO68_gene6395 [Halteria grandinella]|uniref:Uncharacterized protein n=1 Tax=Halteria grandinella TaxID=5974 RepID=A0A8J8SWM5_HALGN|nr:hypothetical protein FGO68_gene6395 [Halteria grandinella]